MYINAFKTDQHRNIDKYSTGTGPDGLQVSSKHDAKLN